jgi:fructosamine-3-kinase
MDRSPIPQKRDYETCFCLAEFLDMEFDQAPDPDKLATLLAQLHTNVSPNGMFGFPVQTVCGRNPRAVTWDKSWTKSFTGQLIEVMRFHREKHGASPEFEATCAELIDVVMTRLLGPLKIQPTSVHGDIWEQNISLNRCTGEIIVFDPGCTYAHNEVELAPCKW